MKFCPQCKIPLQSLSISIVFRFFRREAVINEIVTIEDGTSSTSTTIRIPSSINFGAHSSNNLLNANLSGSFQRNADETTDDENILISNRQNRSAPNLSNTLRVNLEPNVGSSSNSSVGRIGVPAIPNNQFNPSPPISRGRSNMIL